MKNLIHLLLVLMTFQLQAQSFEIGAPDSALNIPAPGAQTQYSFTNPLGHNGNTFTSNVVAVLISPNSGRAGYIYFYDFDFNIPAGATITGLEVIHNSGGCNSGSYTIDSIFLAYGGNIISDAKRDSNNIIQSDTLGSPTDLWSAALDANMVNSNSFGIMMTSTTNGVCTYIQSDLRLKVYYNLCSGVQTSGVPDSTKNLPLTAATLSYTNSGAMNHNGTGFVNAPAAVLTPNNNRTNYLYFYDFDFNVPAGATINGVEFTHNTGACNAGSHTRDTIYLAHNETIISDFKWDSTSSLNQITQGSPTDLWSANLTPGIVNDNSFGIMLHSTGYGICTYLQFNASITIHYCLNGTSYTAISSQKKDASVYPNPCTDIIYVDIPHECIGSVYRIIDLGGRVCASGVFENEKNSIGISDLPKGMYYILYQTDLLNPGKIIRN